VPEASEAIRWLPLGAGRRLAMTEGLREGAHPELAVVVDWAPDEARDRWLERLLGHLAMDIADHLLVGGLPLQPGDTMQCGWSTVRLAAPDPSMPGLPARVLSVEECISPFGPERGFVGGLRRAVHIALSQAAVIERHGLSGQMDPPHSSSMAMVCTRLLESVARRGMLGAVRGPDDDSSASRIWQFDCRDDGHTHEDRASQTISHLRHVVEALPPVLQYLALPADAAFAIADGKVAIFRPGEAAYQFEPGDPLAWRP
jgi:hypothetical protein